MAVEDRAGVKAGETGMLPEGDDRRLLVQRIIASSGFERASQLRKILLYVSQSAILEPDRVVREYDIACKVLDRRKDFDPASDNIVRSQFSNLRRKLDLYFRDEGKAEPLILKIPKGSYVPIFVPVRDRSLASPPMVTPVVYVNDKQEEIQLPASTGVGGRLRFTWRDSILAGVCLFPAVVMGIVLLYTRSPTTGNRNMLQPSDNAFVRFLSQWEGEANVIVPDSSLVSIDVGLNIGNIPVSEYASGQFPSRELAPVKDPAIREILAGIGRMRNTTFNEAMIASDFVTTMKRLGLNARPRYARDLHVSDLNDGNTVVIGGAGSDPWMSLFADKMNFRFIELPQQYQYYFLNVKPAPGEQPSYKVTYSQRGSAAEGYVDVALTQNSSHTGYVLLIAASDQQEAESAATLLLHGKLPPEIAAILARKDLHYFEFFFRGKHLAAQADDSLELVAFRPLS